jgi:hypothetical protein
MNKENKKTENKVEITKMTTVDVTEQSVSENLPELPRYTPLNRNDFSMSIIDNWTEIRTRHQPKRRSFHSSFIYNDYFYIFGGIDIITGKLSDMKRIQFKTDLPAWEDVTPTGAVFGKYLLNFKNP